METKYTGKFISYILRHNPSAIGISLDEGGWACVEELIDGINKSGRKIDLPMLNYIVQTDNKRRFSFSEDRTKIRANQGHSVSVNVEMDERIPPNALYHGTGEKYLAGIKEKGIIKKSRNFVHLSEDVQTAFKVGERHGRPYVLVIDAKAMSDDGYKFFISANGVWQTEYVPYKYVVEIIPK